MTGSFVDVHVAHEEAGPSVSYRSGLSVYEEQLVRGRLVGRAWNHSGFLSAWESVRMDVRAHPMPQSFLLEIDGQDLGSHWEWVGSEVIEGEGRIESILRLRHQIRPVRVAIHMRLDGTAVMQRWLAVTNDADKPAALSAVAPWSGILQETRRWVAHLPSAREPLVSIGYLAGDRWGDEGRFEFHPMPSAGFRVDGRVRRDRYRHPMAIVRNHATGEHAYLQIGWPSGFSFEFDLDADPLVGDGVARLWFRAAVDGPAPLRVIAPGETVVTPSVHLGTVIGDLDRSVQEMHRHLRRSVLRPPTPQRSLLVESGIGPEIEITPSAVHQQIDRAAALGAEVFFIDASWYTPPHGSWYDTVGDWEVDRERFPDGLGPFRDHVRQAGMLFGLWMDAERLGARSRTRAEHPGWAATGYEGTADLGDLADLTSADVATWMESRIAAVIEAHELDFFRLDHNVGSIRAGAARERDGYLENSAWRSDEALFAAYDRLRERFPSVIFENCAGGGGRTDVGMLSRFTHTDVTDWQIAPRSFRITNGMTIALPPEMTDRLLGGQDGQLTADIDFQARLLLFMVPKVTLFDPPGARLNPELVARVRRMTDLYKTFVRPFARESRIFHHTPETSGREPQGWGVIELASMDGDRAIVGVFRLSAPSDEPYRVRPRGLDRGRRYAVTWDGRGEAFERDGAALMDDGLQVPSGAALTSELLVFDARPSR